MYEDITCVFFIPVLPLVMLIAGAVVWRKPPAYKGYGYRTERSESSPEAWAAAQLLCGRLLVLSHLPLLLMSIAAVVIAVAVGISESTAVIMTVAAVFVQLAVLFTALGMTERTLRRQFDRNGRPI